MNKDVREGGKLWIKNLELLIIQNFKKIRITNSKTQEDIKTN